MNDVANGRFEDAIARMRRVEGQARGIVKMMEDERYCVDILNQILALEAAARAARTRVLNIHSASCIEDALASHDKADQSAKVAELLSLIEKISR
jgi:DNA-binding FrmR family transcriptional regulator